MSVDESQKTSVCEACGQVASHRTLYCPPCDSDLIAHFDRLAREEFEGTQIAIDENLRKNHGA